MGADERRSLRANVLLTAILEQGLARIPVRVSNVSEHGALVIGRSLPAEETQVTFNCNGMAVQGFVAWSRQGRAGIQFDSPVEPAALTHKRSMPSAVLLAGPEGDFRRPGFRGNQLSEEEQRIVTEWNRPDSKQSK